VLHRRIAVFLDEEADLSSGDEASSDEDDEDDEGFLQGFIDDATQAACANVPPLRHVPATVILSICISNRDCVYAR
jgi:hypothetical protein